MKTLLRYIVILALCVEAVACIDNDVPYPRSLGKIVAFEVQGQIGEAVIDTVKYTVTVTLADTVNLKKVKLLRMEVSDNATYSPELTSYISLDSDFTYTLSTYPNQNYVWHIIADQKIDRFIRAENQVGEAEFNLDDRSAVFYVSSDLTNVNILDIQLGPSNSVISPDPRTIHDFSSRHVVTLSYNSVIEIWTINAYQKESQIITNAADAWATHAYLHGTYASSMGSPIFMYKKVSDAEWTTIPTSDITITGSNFTAKASGLSSNTAYIYRAVANDVSGGDITFTTESAVQMPNMSFDAWVSKSVNGKLTWFPNADTEENYWWDSGNQGANTIGEANPTSPEEIYVVKGKASRMESISVFGQMAGGNVFSGAFVKTIFGAKIGAQVNFGRPFTTRPSKIHGYYSYEPAMINKAKSQYAGLKGRPDRFHIFMMLFDLDEPYHVDTSEGIFLPPYTDDCVIGYADLVDSVSTGGKYKEFTIPVVYKDNRKPGYCALVAVASYYADFFTGGIGSLMYADEFSFIYDDEITWE